MLNRLSLVSHRLTFLALVVALSAIIVLLSYPLQGETVAASEQKPSDLFVNQDSLLDDEELGKIKQMSEDGEGDEGNNEEQPEIVVMRAYFSNRQMVYELAAWKAPWEVRYDEGYLVIDVNEEEEDRLLAAGFRLEVDETLTEELNQRRTRSAGQVSGIPGYECYRTVEETYATAQGLAESYPTLATWTDIGDSWQKGQNVLDGYDLMVLKLTNSAITGEKPALFVLSAIHAREYATAELNTRFAEYLLSNYNLNADVTWLLDHHEIHLMLQGNPDGRKWAELGHLWRKNTNNDHCANSTSRGIDLNRNFEFRWGCCNGSSGNPCANTYRGPSPASEPEAQAIQSYLKQIFPDQRESNITASAPMTATGVFLDVHSYSQLVLWPWGFTNNIAPNGAALQTLGRKLAYFNNYYPEQAIGLYPTDGTTEDFAYGELGVAAYTFELGTTFFQACSAFEETILPKNLPALLYAAKVARTPYITPAGPDTLDVTLSANTASIGTSVTLTATLNDTRFNSRNGTEATQSIIAAEYYLDTPPWDNTSVSEAFPMSASDLAFDSAIEGVSAQLDTSTLSPGRHTIFVRGQDSDENWGAVSAIFLEIEGYTTYFPFTARFNTGSVSQYQSDIE